MAPWDQSWSSRDIAMDRAAVVVAQSIIEIQVVVKLPRILREKAESVFKHLALGVPFHDVGRRGEAAGEEIAPAIKCCCRSRKSVCTQGQFA